MSSKTLLLAVLFITYQAKAQNADMEKALADAIDIQVGGTFGKPRVSPKVEKLGIAQVSIKFKTVSTAKLNISAKKQGLLGKSSAGSRTASSTAFLNFSDQEMGPQDYQEITNHFYYTLQRKLKENGIDTVAWSNIESTDFFKNAGDNANEFPKTESNDEDASVTYNAFRGGHISNGMGFAFLKMKSNSKMCDAIGAPTFFANIVLDFVDLDIQGGSSVRSSQGNSFGVGASTTASFSAKHNALADIVITNSSSLLSNNKEQAETWVVKSDIPAGVPYATAMEENEEKVKKKTVLQSLFHKSEALKRTPLVVTTTKENYKNAAKKAAENYATAIVGKFKAMKAG